MKILYVICACVALSIVAMAQEPANKGQFKGRGSRAKMHTPGKFANKTHLQPYDEAKEEIFNARIVEVNEHRHGERAIVYLKLNVDGKETILMLGTAEYLKGKNSVFAAGDLITIKGFKFETPRGVFKIHAHEIEKDGLTFEPIKKDQRAHKGRMRHPRFNNRAKQGMLPPGCQCPSAD